VSFGGGGGGGGGGASCGASWINVGASSSGWIVAACAVAYTSPTMITACRTSDVSVDVTPPVPLFGLLASNVPNIGGGASTFFTGVFGCFSTGLLPCQN
jgi:hypothetical protein